MKELSTKEIIYILERYESGALIEEEEKPSLLIEKGYIEESGSIYDLTDKGLDLCLFVLNAPEYLQKTKEKTVWFCQKDQVYQGNIIKISIYNYEIYTTEDETYEIQKHKVFESREEAIRGRLAEVYTAKGQGWEKFQTYRQQEENLRALLGETKSYPQAP